MTKKKAKKKATTKAKKKASSSAPSSLSSSSSSSVAVQRIVAAGRAVLGTNPGATVDEIVAASGVSRATFFRHFSSRIALLRRIATTALADLDNAVSAALAQRANGDVLERLRALLATLVEHGEELRFLAGAIELYEDAEIVAACAAVDVVIAPTIDAAIAAGILRDDLSRAWLMASTDALVFAAWHEVAAGRMARKDAVFVVEATLLRGFGGPAVFESSSGR